MKNKLDQIQGLLANAKNLLKEYQTIKEEYEANSLCQVKKEIVVGFWKWKHKETIIEVNHKYLYISPELRECSNCGNKQIYFGKKYEPHSLMSWEDWRDAK